MQYCCESLWKYHAGVDIFFCFVEFAYKGQLANGITFCRMDQLLGDQLCWELCYLIKKILFSEISLKKAPFSPNNLILKKKNRNTTNIKGNAEYENTNEAFGAFKKNNLISRTCTTEGDITNWSCKDGINPYRYINKVKISVYIQFWHQSWTNPSLEKQPCHPLYS